MIGPELDDFPALVKAAVKALKVVPNGLSSNREDREDDQGPNQQPFIRGTSLGRIAEPVRDRSW